MSLFVDDDDGLNASIQENSELHQVGSKGNNSPPNDDERPDSIPLIIRDEGNDDENDADDNGSGATSNLPPLDVTLSIPLSFQQQIVRDMIEKDGLLILGRGLGLEPITANLLHILSAPSTITSEQTKRSLVILLNAHDDENEKIGEELTELGWIDSIDDMEKSMVSSQAKRPFIVIGGETTTVEKRKKIYQSGGIISVSSRVFTVDLLSEIIDSDLITGIVLLHAERVTETSNESFIINLYRSKNKWGFIKALSDDPESFTGFAPLATKLKNLRLQNTFLWPRFHVDISASLKPTNKNNQLNLRSIVTEINVSMSDSMKQIQTGILACIEACVSELKRHNPTLATEYWSIENALDTQFVKSIRITLDPQWHRISWTSKQLVYDLSTLKDLLHYLINYDSITFYQVIQGIVEANKRPVGSMKGNYSPWLDLDEANTIITYSKLRAFSKTKPISKEEDFLDKKQENYILEELPKWEQLAILLDDINLEMSHVDSTHTGPTLIMCSDSFVCKQLREYLSTTKEIKLRNGSKSYSGRRFMISRLREHLAWKKVSAITSKLHKEVEKSTREPETQEINTSKTFTRGRVPLGKRRRTRGGYSVANVQRLHSVNLDENIDLNEELVTQLQQEEYSEDMGNIDQKIEDEVEQNINDGGFVLDDYDEEFQLLSETPQFKKSFQYEYIDRKNQIIIEKYNNKTDDLILQELIPSYIIMYEPELSFIRRVEVYQAINQDNAARTYFLYYGNSVEEQKHLTRVKKEKDSFTRLIREKAALGTHFSTDEDNNKFSVRKEKVFNTRIAGGSSFKSSLDESRVVVDMREFRSSLPNLLYRIGMRVIPCMITVGDYIISPKICIERKAIPDLISSFKSGRLYTQCEQMFRHYELPVLLIEFDEDKSFSLEPFSEIRSKVGNIASSNPISAKLLQQDIQSKIVMLLIAFPKLKIIWSSSPYQTAQIFLQLKSNQEEPDPLAAVNAGLNTTIGTNGPPQYNDNAIDLIQNIPGITNMNYHLIIRHIRNIQDLVNLSEEELAEIIGSEAANKAYNFMNRSVL